VARVGHGGRACGRRPATWGAAGCPACDDAEGPLRPHAGRKIVRGSRRQQRLPTAPPEGSSPPSILGDGSPLRHEMHLPALLPQPV